LKKLFAILLGVMFIMSFAASAFAIHAEIPSETQAVVAAGSIQLTLSGELRTRGWYRKNITSDALPLETGSAAWYDERVRLAVDAKVAPGIEGLVQLESGNDSTDNYTTWGHFDQKMDPLSVLQAWIVYSGSGLLGFPSGVKVGHMPLALGQMEFFDHTKFGDDAIIFFMLPTKELEIDLLAIKFAGDGNPFTIPAGYYNFNSGFSIDASGSRLANTDDLDGYVGIITYKLDDKNTLGANYTYLNQSQLGFSHQNLGLSASGAIGAVGFKAAVDMQFGKVEAVSQKFRGYAFMAGVNLGMEPANLRASLGYGTGDDDASDGKDKQFETYLGADQHYTLIYDYQVVTAAGRTNAGLSNTTYYNLGIDYGVMKDMTGSLDGYILRATKENPSLGSFSKSAGWEVDAKVAYQLAKNLTYQIDAGYFKAGKLYGEHKESVTLLRHMLTLSF
jgi:hypothetical protein